LRFSWSSDDRAHGGTARNETGHRLTDPVEIGGLELHNSTIPQVAGEPGRCRTPHVVRERARLEQDGAYERPDRETAE
jgi:hypothetical protein